MASTFYQTEENNHITIRWDSKAKTDLSLTNLNCVSQSNIFKVLYEMTRGFETPESAHKQFSKRVLLDKEALREGRIRLHLFLVTAEDSGEYRCYLTANYNSNTRQWGLQASGEYRRSLSWLKSKETAAVTVMCCNMDFFHSTFCPERDPDRWRWVSSRWRSKAFTSLSGVNVDVVADT